MLEYERLARKAEKESNWELAAEYWFKAGNKDAAAACKMIADALKRGDEYRADVDRLIGEEPVFTPDNAVRWLKWHSDLHDIYRKHFRNG